MKLFTVGYEGKDIEGFGPFLKRKKIALVIDVRKNPVSRKKGFSKHKLAAHLAEYKINYLSLPKLGVPSAWRKLAKSHYITREKMFEDYKKKILTPNKAEIELVLDSMKKQNTALLCFEKEALDCHRHFITEKIRKKKRKVQIVDL